MVDVGMGEQDLLERSIGLLQHGTNAVQIAARIDHRRATRTLADQYRAVLLEGRDGGDENLEWHVLRPVTGSAPSITAARGRPEEAD